MDRKLELVVRAAHGEPVRALCREYGVSPKTAYQWLERFAAGGAGTLEVSFGRLRLGVLDPACAPTKRPDLTPKRWMRHPCSDPKASPMS